MNTGYGLCCKMDAGNLLTASNSLFWLLLSASSLVSYHNGRLLGRPAFLDIYWGVLFFLFGQQWYRVDAIIIHTVDCSSTFTKEQVEGIFGFLLTSEHCIALRARRRPPHFQIRDSQFREDLGMRATAGRYDIKLGTKGLVLCKVFSSSMVENEPI